ncbi:MAG: 16S rRNA (adenine(1518)-N(6)/adenine(1519)-N(6))-dimethyltransferase RsmA [Gemmatimonadaceae bacterium]
MRGDSRQGLPPARKRLGQHFLTDRNALERIVEALQLEPGETVIEIGPGRGALTDILATRAGQLIALEIDPLLVPILQERYAAQPHVRIVEGDVLATSLDALVDGAFALVGNVPYYITTPIIFQALRAPRPTRMVFLVQREVAERIAAPPGDRAYGALSANVQALAEVHIAGRVPAGAFHPKPKVDSAIIRLTPRTEPLMAPHEEAPFQKFVQAAFGRRRKQIRRVLREIFSLDAEQAESVLARCGIDPEARPETLSPAGFLAILRHVAAAHGGDTTRR